MQTRRITLTALLVLGLCCGRLSADEPVRSRLLDVFPASGLQTPDGRRGETVFSSDFTPSGSLWDDRLDERHVFQIAMDHRQDAENSFALRIGKGGQVYSLRGPFGESVPPSWRPDGLHLSPWNDEVWQFVAVCTRYNGVEASLRAGALSQDFVDRMTQSQFKTSFFIHHSGVYMPGGAGVESLYCPRLASEIAEEDRCYRTIHWGLIPQMKSVHRSPLLYYCQTRDVGEGVIEWTWVVHNFSVRNDVVFDHLNAPWGGTRVTSLPLRYVSSPDGTLRKRRDILNSHGVVDVRKTGGWNLSCASAADDSPSLALVFGRDKHLEAEQRRMAAGSPYVQSGPSLYRDWRASEPLYRNKWKDWRTRPANSFRNYDVAEVIPKLRLAPGATIWYRSFLVVHRKDRAIALAERLVDHVDYGLLQFASDSTSTLPVSIGGAGFETLPRPTRGTRPLFLIQNSDSGRRIVTTDPYYFVEKEPLDFSLPDTHPHHNYYSDAQGYALDKNHTNWLSLLGYGYETRPEGASWQRLSTVLEPSCFPEPDRYHGDLWVKVPPCKEQ